MSTRCLFFGLTSSPLSLDLPFGCFATCLYTDAMAGAMRRRMCSLTTPVGIEGRLDMCSPRAFFLSDAILNRADSTSR